MNQITEVTLDLIDAPADQQRLDVDEGKLEELRVSIRDHGLINPISLRPIWTHKPGCNSTLYKLFTCDVCGRVARYELISGSRRLKCHHLLKLPTIKAILSDIDEKEADILRAHENEFRHDPNPVESGLYILRLQDKHALTIQEIAKQLNKSETYVRGRIELMTYPDYMLEEIIAGRLSVAAAHHLAMIDPDDKRRQYVRWAVQGGITAAQAAVWLMHAQLGGVTSRIEELPVDVQKNEKVAYRMMAECIICRDKDDVARMGMYYAHEECEKAVARGFGKAADSLADSAAEKEPAAMENTQTGGEAAA